MRSVDELLQNEFKNTCCVTAAIHDALWLNGLEINQDLLFMLGLGSFIHTYEFKYNANTLVGISFSKYNADTEMLSSLGVNYDSVEGPDFDEYIKSVTPVVGRRTSMSDLNGYNNKVNFGYVHTEIFLRFENDMYLTRGMGDTGGSLYANRPKNLVDKARYGTVVPFSPEGFAYRIDTDMKQHEIEEAARKRIRTVITKIKDSYDVLKSPEIMKTFYGEDMYNYDGAACFGKITDFMRQSFELYKERQISKTNLVVNLHTIRRGIMPILSTGDFVRTEICDSLAYAAGYMKNSSLNDAANILDKSKKYWIELGKALYNPREHLEDTAVDGFKSTLLDYFDYVYKIELEAVNAIKVS